MTNKNLDQAQADVTPGSKAGELKEADLESVAGGLMGIATRKTPVPEDGRSIVAIPPPDDGLSIKVEPVPDDGKS